jgi:hypothetical protein
VDFRAQPKQHIISGLTVLAAALIWSASSHAASNSVVPCDQVGRDLKSLEVQVDALPIHVVDHVPIDTDSLDQARTDNDSAAPVLNLTPRVTNILRDVFDATYEELTGETQSQPSSSPLADSDEVLDEVEPADTEANRSDLPRFHRQMFRTDI